MKRGYNLGSSLAEFLCPRPPPNEPNDTSPLHQALPDSPLDHEHIVTDNSSLSLAQAVVVRIFIETRNLKL